MTKILVTGGAGYIGSHTVVALLEHGYEPVILDNLSNSKRTVLDRIKQITGVRPEFVEMDLCHTDKLARFFEQQSFDSVIHFAGLKSVGESVAQPLRYYQNNVVGSLNLFKHLALTGCKRLVFSSSATVYGKPDQVPVNECADLRVTNPYGQTKLMVENILRDLYVADPQWQISILRYFNPVAAHKSGLIGEDPQGIPNNLLPYIAQVAVGRREVLPIFGDDYATKDGTGVRDYIHVCDLAQAHLKALQALDEQHSCQAYNIGTGEGYSVLDMVAAFEQASGRSVPYEIKPRRSGDIDVCFADPTLSGEKLGWQAKYGLDRMMQDHWRWQSGNPEGYK